jgi:hypothetical protein
VRRFHVHVSDALYERIRAHSIATGRPMTEIVERAVFGDYTQRRGGGIKRCAYCRKHGHNKATCAKRWRKERTA